MLLIGVDEGPSQPHENRNGNGTDEGGISANAAGFGGLLPQTPGEFICRSVPGIVGCGSRLPPRPRHPDDSPFDAGRIGLLLVVDT